MLIIISCKTIELEEFYTYKTQMTHPLTYGGFFNNSTAYTVGRSGSAFVSHNKGESFTYGKNTAACLFGLDIISENQAWACGNLGNIIVTVDGGKIWKKVNDFGPKEPNHCRYLSFLDQQTGWIASPKLLASTQDSGKTWEPIKLPEQDTKISAIFLRSKKEGYLFDDYKGNLYITADGGQNWLTIATGEKAVQKQSQEGPTAIVRFKDTESGLIIFNNFSRDEKWVLIWTENGGKSWNKSKIAIPMGYIYLSKDNKIITITDSFGKMTAYKIDMFI